MTETLLVTGSAGFIGCTLVSQMVERGNRVINLDTLIYA